MTWVIGMVGLFTGALAASDVRVSWKDTQTGEDRHLDCPQKVNPVAPNAVLGFSGSAEFGFYARDTLVQHLGGQELSEAALEE